MSDKIAVGFHSFGTCTIDFAISLASLTRYEGSRLSNTIHVPSPYVTEARNKVVYQFLHHTKANYLLMVDVDMKFNEDALTQTYFTAKSVKADVMFGCYSLGDFRPSIFGPPQPGSNLPTVPEHLDAGQIYNIFAGSTGWLLLTREGAEAIKDANTHRHWPWFDHDIEYAGEAFPLGELAKKENFTLRIGEDFSFSKRAREAGIKLWGTTVPLLIHTKYQPLLPHFQEETARALGLMIRGGVGDGSKGTGGSENSQSASVPVDSSGGVHDSDPLPDGQADQTNNEDGLLRVLGTED